MLVGLNRKLWDGWKIAPVDEKQLEWRGEIAGPDRLRFLGMLSRYVGLLKGIDMVELDPGVTLQ